MSLDNKFEEGLLQKIKDEKILPKPRWCWSLNNVLAWLISLVALLLSALAIAAIIYIIDFNNLRNPANYGRLSFFELVSLAPYFWVIILLLLAVLAYYYIRNTKKGYKYSSLLIISLGLVAILIFSFVFRSFGLGRLVDDLLGRNTPFYDRIINPDIEFWSNSKEGRLSGIILEKIDQRQYSLLDSKKQTWQIAINNNVPFPEIDKLRQGQLVKLYGKDIGQSRFIVNEIIPMEPGRGFFENLKDRQFPPKDSQELNNMNRNFPEVDK